MGTALADHFGQFGREHSILRNADMHNVNWVAQPTAPSTNLGTCPLDKQAQTLQVLNCVFESHRLNSNIVLEDKQAKGSRTRNKRAREKSPLCQSAGLCESSPRGHTGSVGCAATPRL